MRSLPHTIITADWGKSERKRRAVRIDLEALTVESVPPHAAGRLETLLRVAPGSGTLIGIDAVFGIPEYVGRASGSKGFLDWLARGQRQPRFLEAVARAEDWSPWRPFWINPPGEGSQTRFFHSIRTSHREFPPDHGLRRKIDRWARAKPPTCVSGMPGTVGWATLELWREFAGTEGLVVWPFAGVDLPGLLAGAKPVVVEAYPAICYGIVLAESLPARYVPVAKTKPAERAAVLRRLTRSPAWEPKLRIADEVWSAAHGCEDDFDALFLGLALYRLALEGQLNPGGSALGPELDPDFEGGIVGSWCVLRPAANTSSRLGAAAGTVMSYPFETTRHGSRKFRTELPGRRDGASMTKVTITLPDDVHQALEEESGRLGRSIESLIEERLRSSGPTAAARVAHLVAKARQSSGLDERRALETAVGETRARRES